MELQRRKIFSRNYLQFGQAPSKWFASPALGQQIMKRCRIITLPGVPVFWADHMVTSCRKMPWPT